MTIRDKELFEHKGFKCAVVEYGAEPVNAGLSSMVGLLGMGMAAQSWWCGYVVLPKGHKYHGKDYYDIDIECHGGLTYSDEFEQEGVDFKGYAIGFDMNHAMDSGGSKTEAIEECKRIVGQL